MSADTSSQELPAATEAQPESRSGSRSGSRPLLVIEAAGCLFAARVLLLVMPFARISRYLGQAHPPQAAAQRAGPELVSKKVAQDVASEVARAIRRAAALLPFPLVCLPRALAGMVMLRRRAVACELHFGGLPQTRQANQPPVASLHAWLAAGAVEVTGYPAAHAAVELGFFALSPSRRR